MITSDRFILDSKPNNRVIPLSKLVLNRANTINSFNEQLSIRSDGRRHESQSVADLCRIQLKVILVLRRPYSEVVSEAMIGLDQGKDVTFSELVSPRPVVVGRKSHMQSEASVGVLHFQVHIIVVAAAARIVLIELLHVLEVLDP